MPLSFPFPHVKDNVEKKTLLLLCLRFAALVLDFVKSKSIEWVDSVGPRLCQCVGA